MTVLVDPPLWPRHGTTWAHLVSDTSLDELHAGAGYVPEGVALILRHAFDDLRLHRIEAAIVPRNQPSRRVAAKLGLRDEGTALRFLQIRGTYEDLEFVVFDFRRPDSGQAATAWIVYLPCPSRTFVEWATSEQPLYRRPLHLVGVRADAIVDIGREQHRSTEPDSVLRQIRALTEIVRRFEARAAASS